MQHTLPFTEELSHRSKNGLLAAVGAFGISALASYRVSQEMAYDAKTSDIFKVAGFFAALAGIIWAMMPQATRPPSEHIDEARAAVTEPIKVLFGRVIQSHQDLRTAARDIERKYSYTGSTSWTSVSPDYSFGSTSSRPGSYERGWAKADSSVFDDSDMLPPDEDDFVTDEDLEEIYSDLNRKYGI